jgi:hypothetical protein
VFQGIPQRAMNDAEIDFEAVKSNVSEATSQVLESLITETNASFGGSSPATLFKNLTKCKELDVNVEAQQVLIT